jgi:hypothetical protein
MTAYPTVNMQIEWFIRTNLINGTIWINNNICECQFNPEKVSPEEIPNTITGEITIGAKKINYRGIRQDQDGFISKADDTYINYLVEVI